MLNDTSFLCRYDCEIGTVTDTCMLCSIALEELELSRGLASVLYADMDVTRLCLGRHE